MTSTNHRPICKRCGKEMELNEIHIFRGGEDRRLILEKYYQTKVSLCTNPPSGEFWKDNKPDDFVVNAPRKVKYIL